MADTFTNDLRLRLQESGANSGQWGSLLNDTITNIASAFSLGSEAIPNASTHTITLADDSSSGDEARSLFLKCTGGGQACTVTLAPNTVSKVWIISNETSFTLTFSAGSGANVAVAAGAVKVIVTDGAGSGAAVVDALSGLDASLSGLTVDTTTLVVDATNNRVGIGDSSPSNTLTITNGSSGATEANGAIVPLMIENSSSAYINFLTPNNANAGFLFSDPQGNNVGQMQYLHGSDALVFATAATERMRIDSSGNVGIGTSSTSTGKVTVPLAGVAVTGDTDGATIGAGGIINLVNTNGGVTDSTIMLLGSTSDSTLGQIASGIGFTRENSGNWGTQLRFYTHSTPTTDIDELNEAMRIDSSGNVTIGSVASGTSTSTPVELNLGSTFADSAGSLSKAKLKLFEDSSANVYGLSVSNGLLEFGAPTGANHAFFIGESEKMRIDSSGNVGIGTSSPQAAKFSGTASGILELAGTKPVINIHETDVTDAELYMGMSGGSAVIGTTGNGQLIFQTGTSSTSEAMRIDSSGNLMVGLTSEPTANQQGVFFSPDGFIKTSRNGTTNKTHVQFFNNNGAVGSIVTNASVTVYNTSSDQRLKENIADADDAGSKVDAIQVRQFDWIADGAHQDYGMVAQELLTVAPEAVSAPEDPEEMMGVDYSKLVPMLVKEIQSLRSRVQQLENN